MQVIPNIILPSLMLLCVVFFFVQMNSSLNDPFLGKVGLVVKNPDFTFNKEKVSKVWHFFASLFFLHVNYKKVL